MGSYQLGVDVGTTYTAAATGRDGRVEVCGLGDHGPVVPTVVHVDAAGAVLVGVNAVRRGVREPDRVAREFKRRVGDPAPLLLGGAPFAADVLLGRVLRWTVEAVTRREGSPPTRLALCHPAGWGPYKLDLLLGAARRAEIDDIVLIPEPVAAAHHYAQRADAGPTVAVYDLGGGTFDATVLRRTADGRFTVLGRPEGIERLGGIDVDEAVFQHVLRFVGDAVGRLDRDDPATVADLARLRRECTEAKEALSTDTETAVPVVLPNLRTEIRLARAELEELIRGPLLETVAALRRALRSAGVAVPDRVLLVGGSSRIPLVAELVAAELDRPVAVDAHPKHAVALGAALLAAPARAPGPAPARAPGPAPARPPRPAPVRATVTGAAAGSPAGHPAPRPTGHPAGHPAPDAPVPVVAPAPAAPAGGARAADPVRRRRLAGGVGVGLLAAAGIVTALVLARPPDQVTAPARPAAAAAPAVPPATPTPAPPTAGTTTAGTSTAVTLAPAALPAGCPASGPALCISGVDVSDGELVATLVAREAELAREPEEGQFRARFFIATTPSRWLPWGSTNPFRGDLGQGGDELCVVLDDHRGSAVAGSGHCVPLAW